MPGPHVIQDFGLAVRQLREGRGWSQEQLAGQADLNRSYVGEIERGRAVASLATVEKLAGSLGMPPSALVERGETLVRARGARLAAIAG